MNVRLTDEFLLVGIQENDSRSYGTHVKLFIRPSYLRIYEETLGTTRYRCVLNPSFCIRSKMRPIIEHISTSIALEGS